jgi:acetoin utilization deacetylase AcuC-like enzyme
VPAFLSRWLRILRREPRPAFFYSRRYTLELPAVAHDARRGERILAFLDASGLLRADAVTSPEVATFRQLCRVHSYDYLESLNRPGALLKIVGLTLPDEVTERVLEAQRFMAGGTVAAARTACESGGVVVSLGGGLHHAFHDRGERFCAYNDVAVAIAELRAGGFAGRVLVVDLDLHDGDGTRALFAADETVHTFSIHNRTTPGIAAVEATVVELGSGVEDAPYLGALRQHLPAVVERFRPDLVFYLAGCDPAVDDEIGDWRISAEALLERDRFVVATAHGGDRRERRERRPPLVLLLAGGYGLNSWRYSARFLSALLHRGQPVEPPSTGDQLLASFRDLARRFEVSELTGDPQTGTPETGDLGLSEEDITASLGVPRPPHRFLGFYSRQGLELALERAGLLDRLRQLGFTHLTLELDLGHPVWETVRLYGDAAKRELLIELRVRIDRQAVPGFALVRIEWLLLQNPRAHFTAERPPLPGQKHPGLGLLSEIVVLMVLACDRLQLDGVVFVPAHYHTAVPGRHNLRFLEPEAEGRFRALSAALRQLPLAEAVRALGGGKVIDATTGQPVAWQPAAMVLPVSARLKAQVDSPAYEARAAAEAARHSYRLAADGDSRGAA